MNFGTALSYHLAYLEEFSIFFKLMYTLTRLCYVIHSRCLHQSHVYIILDLPHVYRLKFP